MPSSIFLVGNIVIDTKIAVDGSISVSVGGPPSFGLNYLFNACKTEKKKIQIISCNPVPVNHQEDIDQEFKQLLENTGPHIFTPSRAFTRFTLDYSTGWSNDEDRGLFLTSFSGQIDPYFIDNLPENAVVILGPVYREITSEILEKLASREDLFIAIDPQGFLRRVGEDQRVYPKNLPKNFPFGLFSVIKFSIDDLKLVLSENPEQIVKKMEKLVDDPEKTILLTLGEKGTLVIQSERIIRVKAISSKVIDQTGAGDVFLSAFVNSYVEKKDLKLAIEMATAASSCLIEKYGIKGVENHEEILRRSMKCTMKEQAGTSISDILRKL